MRRWHLGVIAAGVFALLSPGALAHDGYWTGSIGVGDPPAPVVHEDADPFKGWLFITVQNSGTEPWGDFHFSFYDPIGGQPLDNLAFLDVPPPVSSQSPLSWAIDNTSVPATLDLLFYSDPVGAGEIATFSIYTDNPDHLSFFGVMLHPTPVPEPASLLLVAVGLLLRRR